MFKNVLVGTDGSATASQAVETAAQLARDWNATLHIVTAYSSGTSGMAAASGSPLADTGTGEAFHKEAAHEVTRKAAANFGNGVETQTHAVPGNAPDAIIDTAAAVGADLIVVGSKGMQGVRRVLGSVPNSVAHNAPCAVLIVKTA